MSQCCLIHTRFKGSRRDSCERRWVICCCRVLGEPVEAWPCQLGAVGRDSKGKLDPRHVCRIASCVEHEASPRRRRIQLVREFHICPSKEGERGRTRSDVERRVRRPRRLRVWASPRLLAGCATRDHFCAASRLCAFLKCPPSPRTMVQRSKTET